MTRPPIPAVLAGGCACGAVRYRLTARPHAVNACHCLDCKRLSGGDASIILHQSAESVVVEGGALDIYRRTADSGREIDVMRCAACGTRLWHRPLAVPSLTLVLAGTLDEAAWVVPTSHIWMKRAGASTVPAPDALTFDEGPPDRQVLWDRFAAAYPG